MNAAILHHEGNYKGSTQLYNKSQQLSVKNGDEITAAICNINIANNYFKEEDYRASITSL